jgi:hypothetical protein
MNHQSLQMPDACIEPILLITQTPKKEKKKKRKKRRKKVKKLSATWLPLLGLIVNFMGITTRF